MRNLDNQPFMGLEWVAGEEGKGVDLRNGGSSMIAVLDARRGAGDLPPFARPVTGLAGMVFV